MSSINAVYDVFNLYAPLLNRARLFLQSLQANKDLARGKILPDDLLREWTCIVRQLRFVPCVGITRSVGDRHDPYQLIAFTDASQSIYGVVVYIKNLRTGKTYF